MGSLQKKSNARTGTNGRCVAWQQGPCNFVNQYIDFAGKIYRVLVVGNAFDQHCKFVTPDTRQEIRAPQPGGQRLG